MHNNNKTIKPEIIFSFLDTKFQAQNKTKKHKTNTNAVI